MKIRLFIITIALITSALVTGWFFDQQTVSPATREALQIPDNIDYYLSKVDYRAMNEQGKLGYRLKTPYLEHYIKEDLSSIRQPEFEVIGSSTRWSIRSRQATLQHQQERFELTRQVELQRQSTLEPMRLNTHLMILLARDNIIEMPQALTLKTPSLSLQANSALINLDTDRYQFTNVRSTYQPPARERLHDDS